MGALLTHWRAGQTARLVAMLHAFNTDTAQSRIGGDDRVHAGFDQCLGNLRSLFVGHVRRDLDRQRHMLAVTQGQFGATGGQISEQLLERVTELQAAQARGVWRADVDGDVAGVGVNLVQADQVIVDRTLDRGVEVLADIDPQYALVFRRSDPRQQVIDTEVVEAHAVDDRLGFRQAEDPWFRVTRLRTRGHGTDFDKAETQLRKAVDGRAVLVQTCRQPYRVRKLQPHDGHRHFRRRLAQQAVEAQTSTRADQIQRQIVGGFRGKFEQQLTGQGVHGRQ